MNQKEIKELIEFLIEKDIAEFELERGDVKVRIKRAAPEPPQPNGLSACRRRFQPSISRWHRLRLPLLRYMAPLLLRLRPRPKKTCTW